jgi:3-deoxy-manno-octulosonate cytidylyltransferase (CMP-KDO synthetase)
MKTVGIIPVRFQSTRFPGKALVDIKGKSMVERVYRQASAAAGLEKVLVATDHQSIYDHVMDFGGEVCMTSQQHPSGTDRCREAMEQLEHTCDFVVNIQGDEPFIDPRQIDALVDGLDGSVQIATQARKIEQFEKLADPNCVKVIMDRSSKALYFSRTPLPYLRNVPPGKWLEQFDFYQHIGLYAYHVDVLREITELPVSNLENAEGLEQLRWLENGYSIKVLTTNYHADGIDTPEDLERAIGMHVN